MVQCVAFGCFNSSNNKVGKVQEEGVGKLQFFRFPKDPVRRAKWTRAVRRVDPKTKQTWIPSEHSRLCSKHFSSEHINYTYHTPRLKDEAVPTIFSGYPPNLQPTTKAPAQSTASSNVTSSKQEIKSTITRTQMWKLILEKKAEDHQRKVEQKTDLAEAPQSSDSPIHEISSLPIIEKMCDDQQSTVEEASTNSTESPEPSESETEELPVLALLEETSNDQQRLVRRLRKRTKSPQSSESATQQVPALTLFEDDSCKDCGNCRALKEENIKLRSTCEALKIGNDQLNMRSKAEEFRNEKLTARIESAKVLLKKKNRQLKTEMQVNRRLMSRITTLKQSRDELKSKCLAAVELEKMLNGMPDIGKQLFLRNVKDEYSEDVREFAHALHCHSPKAYEFVRKSFNSYLPHSRTLNKWIASGNDNPGVSRETSFVSDCEESVDTLGRDSPLSCTVVIDEQVIES